MINTLKVVELDAVCYIKSLHAVCTAKQALENLRCMAEGSDIPYRHNYDRREAAEQLVLLHQQLHRPDILNIHLEDLGTDEAEIEGFEKEILRMAAKESANLACGCGLGGN